MGEEQSVWALVTANAVGLLEGCCWDTPFTTSCDVITNEGRFESCRSDQCGKIANTTQLDEPVRH